MAEQYQEDIGVEKGLLSDYFKDVKETLKLMSMQEFPVEQRMKDGRVRQVQLENVRQPVLVIGPPGIGKTCGILSAVKEVNEELEKKGLGERKFNVRKIMLGQTIVGELQGLPVHDQKSNTVRRLQSPDLPRTDGTEEYGVLFLDEITTADEAQVLPALAFTDDTRNIGTYSLPEHWLVICAGNGPESSNFNRLDDTVLNRCRDYDIEFDYKRDWRLWALSNNINPLIIAFLNFNPDWAHKEIMTEEDRSGKTFASPRSWTNLSEALDNRELQGRDVPMSQMYQFAAGFIGKAAASEFSAFCAFKDDVDYDAVKIINGTERKPDDALQAEKFHILMQSIVAHLKGVMYDECKGENENGEKDYSEKAYQSFANVIDWLITLKKYMLDLVIEGITQITAEVPDTGNILQDNEFLNFCPAFDTFLDETADAIDEVL